MRSPRTRRFGITPSGRRSSCASASTSIARSRPIPSSNSRLNDATGLIELGEEEHDEEVIAEAEASLAVLRTEVSRREVEALLSGEADGNDTFLEVHAGAGGTESQDWAEMLLRMYMRWAEQQRYKVELIESNAGEEAGLKSATIQIKGQNAFGWLKTESGVHRLVRISPYDSNARGIRALPRFGCIRSWTRPSTSP